MSKSFCPKCKSDNYTTISYIPFEDRYKNQCNECDTIFLGVTLNRSY